MDLLYSSNRNYYSDTSRQPENVGQMVGFLNSYEPGLISDNIAQMFIQIYLQKREILIE